MSRPAPAPAAANHAHPSVLRLADVTAGYGETTVLRGVSFSVAPGQVVALLGPNGAGKTTTLRAASGIIQVTSGRIELAGTDVGGYPPSRRARDGLCLIPEGRGIFRSLTVRENLRLYSPSRRAVTPEVIERALAVFPALRKRMKEPAGRLSGGQQQMLALARAYLTDPKVILLDEVSMGLAPLLIDEMFQALHDLARTGVAMLLVEQYVSRALSMADQVVLIEKGTVSYDGPSSGLDEEAVLRGYLGGSLPVAFPVFHGQHSSPLIRSHICPEGHPGRPCCGDSLSPRQRSRLSPA
jgi:branched-chain amino acid transport system ATP-binding protein